MPFGPFESFTDCMERFEGDVGDPAAFCQWLGQQHGWSRNMAEVNLEALKEQWNTAEHPAELTGPVFKQDAKKQIAYAAVLLPGEPDSDYLRGEKILNPEEIERVAHKWMEDYRNIDLQHTLNTLNAVPVESYLLPMDYPTKVAGNDVTLPKGTWVIGTKFRDNAVWKRIENGQLTGYSVMGVPKSAVKEALEAIKSGNEAALKRTLLRDLGDDWIAPFVSVVDNPAVPKAKWFALKQQAPDDINMEEAHTAMAKALKEGRRLSGASIGQLKAAVEALNKLLNGPIQTTEDDDEESKSEKRGVEDMDEQQVKDLIKTEVGEAVKATLGEQPLSEQIANALKEAQKSEAKTENKQAKKDDDQHNDEGEHEDDAAQKELRDEIASLKSKIDESDSFRKSLEDRLNKMAGKASIPASASKEASNGREHDNEAFKTSDGVERTRDAFGRARRV